MKILFIANRFPYPPYRGDKLKIYNLACKLSKTHDLFLITFVQDKHDYSYLPELKELFKIVRTVYLPKHISILKCLLKLFSKKPFQIIYFQSGKFKRELDQFLKEINADIIHTQHLRMSQYSSSLKKHKRILDLPDAYSLYWQRRAFLKKNIIQNLFGWIEFRKVLRYENVIKNYDLNLVCSEEDKQFLIEKHGECNIEILPNGVDLDVFYFRDHDYSINNRIIFTGNMDYFPNVDAVCYFVYEIFPLILRRIPDIKFYVVGQKPLKKVLDLQRDNVIVTGFIKNLNEEYNKNAVAVSPIRYGAGTLNKVLEPMAMGIPVVTTNVGFKGLGIESGNGAVLAEGPEDFARKVVELLEDRKYREEVGMKGLKIISDRFGWDKISDLLESYFVKII